MQSKEEDLDVNICINPHTLTQISLFKHANTLRSANARMIEDILLVWLDENINEETDSDCRHTIDQLGKVVYLMKTFNNVNQCVNFIEKMRNDRIYLIVSGSLGQNIVSQIHDLNQIESIFIFCSNKTFHEIWTKQWTKILGIHTEIEPICQILKQINQKHEENLISIHSGDQSFLMFIKIFKDILRNLPLNDVDLKNFCDFCRQNHYDLKYLDKFENKYVRKSPIAWYSQIPFLYSLLNRALQLIDMNILFKISFFIRDLDQQINEIYHKQRSQTEYNQIFTVYHGQGISRICFENILKTKSECICFRNFLCASEDRRISFDFLHRAILNPNLIGILFVITIDPKKSTTPFAFSNEINHYEGKEEVIFSFDTIFRIREMQSMDERLYQINLSLVNQNDEEHRLSIENETYCWNRLGQWLIQTNQLNKAEEIYRILSEEIIDKHEREFYLHEFEKLRSKLTINQSIVHNSNVKQDRSASKQLSERIRLQLAYLKQKLTLK